MSSRIFPSSLVTAISVLVYLNSLEGDFAFDDHRAILTNDDLDVEKRTVWEVFEHDFWGGTMSRKESHKSFRPLTVLTFRYLNHYFSGLRPFSYHLVNVLLHAGCSVLFLEVCRLLLLGKEMWATFAACLFAAHSIHTEAVASVVGRAEVLCGIFYLLSFLSYARGVVRISGRTDWKFLTLSLFLTLCSLLSKEQGITSIGVCAAYDVLLHWPRLWRRKPDSSPVQDIPNEESLVEMTSCNEQSQPASNQALQMGKRVSVLVVVGMVMMWCRMLMNRGSEPIFKPEEMRAAYHPNRSVRIMSFSNIYVWNAWLLLSPSCLCCDWSLGSLPLVTTLSDYRNIYSVILYTSLAALALMVLRGKRNVVELGVSLAFLLIPFLPAAGIVMRVGFVIAERVLYLPSMGSCLLVTVGAKRLSQLLGDKALRIGLVYVVLVNSVKTTSRNWDWATDLALFQSGVVTNPNNVKMHNNYAMELKERGQLEEARHHYLYAMEIEPDYSEVYFNYGNLLSDEGNYLEAATFFEKAISYPTMYSKTLNNLATTYFRLQRYKEAEQRFKESIELSPDQSQTLNNLASLYGETKRFRESEEMFRKAIQMNPVYTEAYFNLGTLLYQMGRTEEAKGELNHALLLNPNHHGARNNLHVIEYYQKKG